MIDTSAEVAENAALPRVREVHTDPARPCPSDGPLPAALTESPRAKSPAQWAYERIILYIQKFEETLDSTEEVGMGFVGGEAGIMHIEGLGYFDPDIVTYYGRTPDGSRTQLIQHVSQLNVMLVAAPRTETETPPTRIGFRLARELERDSAADAPSSAAT